MAMATSSGQPARVSALAHTVSPSLMSFATSSTLMTFDMYDSFNNAEPF
jgi:hypothetical protein